MRAFRILRFRLRNLTSHLLVGSGVCSHIVHGFIDQRVDLVGDLGHRRAIVGVAPLFALRHRFVTFANKSEPRLGSFGVQFARIRFFDVFRFGRQCFAALFAALRQDLRVEFAVVLVEAVDGGSDFFIDGK